MIGESTSTMCWISWTRFSQLFRVFNKLVCSSYGSSLSSCTSTSFTFSDSKFSSFTPFIGLAGFSKSLICCLSGLYVSLDSPAIAFRKLFLLLLLSFFCDRFWGLSEVLTGD